MCAGAVEDQEVWDKLELEPQVAVSCLMPQFLTTERFSRLSS